MDNKGIENQPIKIRVSRESEYRLVKDLKGKFSIYEVCYTENGETFLEEVNIEITGDSFDSVYERFERIKEAMSKPYLELAETKEGQLYIKAEGIGLLKKNR